MSANNIAPAPDTSNGSAGESEAPRDHTVTLSVTAEEFLFLERHASQLKEPLGRRTVPIARAAYDVFRRGYDAMAAAVA
jgi:hypothetical protein